MKMSLLESKLLKKILISLIIFFTLIFIFQITLAQDFNFSNGLIDNYFHFSQVLNVVLIFFLLLFLLLINSKQTWEQVVTGILILPITLLLLFGIVILPETDVRHYFFNKDGYSYYIVNEGRINLKVYKEKPAFFFIKERKRVTEDELKSNGIDYSKEYDNYLKKYFK
jgi:hypothetical protein